MTTNPIVKYFDVVKDPMPGLGSGCIQTGVDLLYFESVEEGLGAGSSSTAESHRHALTEPYVSLSAHTPFGCALSTLRFSVVYGFLADYARRNIHWETRPTPGTYGAPGIPPDDPG